MITLPGGVMMLVGALALASRTASVLSAMARSRSPLARQTTLRLIRPRGQGRIKPDRLIDVAKRAVEIAERQFRQPAVLQGIGVRAEPVGRI